MQTGIALIRLRWNGFYQLKCRGMHGAKIVPHA